MNLLPCPFCGGEMQTREHTKTRSSWRFYVEHVKLETDECPAGDLWFRERSHEQAVAAWNTRPAEAQLEAALQLGREALQSCVDSENAKSAEIARLREALAQEARFTADDISGWSSVYLSPEQHEALCRRLVANRDRILAALAGPPAMSRPAGTWRVGTKLGRTLYNGHGDFVGVMDTAALAAIVVEAVNAERDEPAPAPTQEPAK